MDMISTVRARILRLCNEHDMTIHKLATISAVPPSSVKNILYGRSNDPRLSTIKKLCDGLEITLGEFFSTPEFDGLEQEIK
ncbi:MAG: helix-turn-helix domain-containing protein [Oscillospiraceae bacterium]|nr:helix-turn-helix domain-containing protein [Oscillospiraceae bacterium]